MQRLFGGAALTDGFKNAGGKKAADAVIKDRIPGGRRFC